VFGQHKSDGKDPFNLLYTKHQKGWLFARKTIARLVHYVFIGFNFMNDADATTTTPPA
jgi:hypothetical protein